jgi:hypothetical protein
MTPTARAELEKALPCRWRTGKPCAKNPCLHCKARAAVWPLIEGLVTDLELEIADYYALEKKLAAAEALLAKHGIKP